MSVSVILYQTRSVISTGYRVESTITSSSGIVKEIFVKRESTYEYDRVATVDDIITLPAEADPSYGYFRDDACQKDFIDPTDAKYFADGLKTRIETLMEAYEEAVDNFQGSDVTVISN